VLYSAVPYVALFEAYAMKGLSGVDPEALLKKDSIIHRKGQYNNASITGKQIPW